MTNNKSANSNLPLSLVLVFCISTAILLLAKNQLETWHIDTKVAIVGNMILFVVTLVQFLLYKRATLHPTTVGFLGNTYGGLFLKLVVCIIAVLLYKFAAGEQANKPAILVCVFLYFIYTILETVILMQWNKSRRNA